MKREKDFVEELATALALYYKKNNLTLKQVGEVNKVSAPPVGTNAAEIWKDAADLSEMKFMELAQ